jgi:hypothetical protein
VACDRDVASKLMRVGGQVPDGKMRVEMGVSVPTVTFLYNLK